MHLYVPAIDELDRWLGMICEAAEEAGTLQDTDIFIVSDHGQQEVRRNIEINVLLQEHGFIRLAEDGSIADWDAYCLSNGMSALIFLKDKTDKALYDRVYQLLKDLLKEEVYGFSRVYTEEEARR